jgi:hypothetical protein
VTGSALPEKTGFAVPAPGQTTGPEQTGALASLVRPLTASTNPTPQSTAPQSAPTGEQSAQPSPQSQAINNLLHQQSRQPQELPPSQSQPRTSQSNPVFQPGSSPNQQPTSQPESVQNQRRAYMDDLHQIRISPGNVRR